MRGNPRINIDLFQRDKNGKDRPKPPIKNIAHLNSLRHCSIIHYFISLSNPNIVGFKILLLINAQRNNKAKSPNPIEMAYLPCNCGSRMNLKKKVKIMYKTTIIFDKVWDIELQF